MHCVFVGMFHKKNFSSHVCISIHDFNLSVFFIFFILGSGFYLNFFVFFYSPFDYLFFLQFTVKVHGIFRFGPIPSLKVSPGFFPPFPLFSFFLFLSCRGAVNLLHGRLVGQEVLWVNGVINIFVNLIN